MAINRRAVRVNESHCNSCTIHRSKFEGLRIDPAFRLKRSERRDAGSETQQQDPVIYFRTSSSHCRVRAFICANVKKPAVQESRSKDAVETLDKWTFPRASWINIVGANPMLQEPFLHLAGHNLLELRIVMLQLLQTPNFQHCHAS